MKVICIYDKNSMKFTLEEIEIIKDALTVSLDHCMDHLEDYAGVIKILDRIDEETDLD